MTRRGDSLFRSTGGVLLGFVVIAAVPILGRLAIDSLVPPDNLLQPGGFAPTGLFIGLQLALALIAAVLAGFLCRMAAGHFRAVLVLASIAAIMAGLHALMLVTLPQAPPEARTGNEPPQVVQAQLQAAQPHWLTLAIPVLLTGGIVLAGSRPARRG